MSELELSLRRLVRDYGADFIKQARCLLDDVDKHKWYLSERAGRDVGYDAAIADWNARYGRFENPEILGIEREYKAGRYSVLEDKLVKFVSNNKNLIDKMKNYSSDSLIALKLLLLKRKSIDMPTESRMQIEEIQKEAWYRGTNDCEKVALDWAKRHAAGWRDNYTLVLTYILEVKKEKFQQLL